jgi:biopolymer transport protein ExbD
VLLIFFILTTTYATAVQKVVPMPTVQSQEGKKARVVSREQLRHMIRMEAELDRAGKPVIRVQNQTVSALADDGTVDVDRLRDILRPYVRGESGKTEVILDARAVSWGTVISIQDAARSAGVRKVHHLLRK